MPVIAEIDLNGGHKKDHDDGAIDHAKESEEANTAKGAQQHQRRTQMGFL